MVEVSADALFEPGTARPNHEPKPAASPRTGSSSSEDNRRKAADLGVASLSTATANR